MADERFDGLLMNLAQQAGSIDNIFDAYFGFLARKTDFFVGCATKEDAMKVCRAAFDKHFEKAQELKAATALRNQKLDDDRKKRKAEQDKKDREEYEKKLKEKEAAKKEAAVPFIEELGDDGQPLPEEKEKLLVEDVPEEKSKEKEEEKEEEEDSGPPPLGNGGACEKYTWTQTLSTCDMYVHLRPGTKSKDLSVTIKAEHLTVAYKNDLKNPIVKGDLYGKVKVEDCTWLLVDNKCCHVSFEKVDTMKWWATVIKGDAEIDTKKIVPENSKLSDLDGETRQTVEKMMYDQKQKQLGLPSSDQQKQHDLLDKFKAAHPEMDFSKCKINYGDQAGGPGNFNFGGV